MNVDRFQSHASGRLVETWYDDKPYLAFVPHPLPPDLKMDRELSLALSDADRALGELAGLGRTLSNPKLLLGPFLRREAVLSSRIEGTQTGITDLYAFEAGQLSLPGMASASSRSDAQEVLNYVRALEFGLQRIKTTPVTLTLLRDLHRLLMKDARGRGGHAGEFRTDQNWIGSSSIRSALFVPPPVSEMQAALDTLENYLQASHDYPPLLRIALSHYQFEAIHPFGDGNGRTGRLLISLLIMHWGLLSQPLLYLSAFFEKHRESYFELLLAVSELGLWREWVLFFLEGIIEQSRSAIELVKALQDLHAEWHKRLTKIRVSSLVISLSDRLFDSPLMTISEAQRMLGTTSYNTARRSVQKLVDVAILQPQEEGYSKPFLAQEILRLLEE